MKICPVCKRKYPDDGLFCPEDGAGLVPAGGDARPAPSRPAEPIDPLVGRPLFGSYIIRKKLGEGGMGAVYLAENKSIDQRIAVKVLHDQSAQSDELVKRFNREAKALCRLTHPNITRVFVFGTTDDGLIYLAMEFVEGKPLRDIMEKEGRIDELRAINILRQTLHALAEAHELGIVHRDLKPDNIMLTNFRGVKEFVKVLDFGIAKVKEQDGSQQKLTQAGVVYGTPEYLSPEQAQAKELDGRSDIYSMGCILYEMITGQVPFQSNTAVAILASHVYDKPKPPSQVAREKISPRMERIILKAMEKDPAKRYQSAMEFLADLEGLEAELTGNSATRTTVLDAAQISLILEVSRAQQQKRDVPAAPLRTTPGPDAPTIRNEPLVQAAAPMQPAFAEPANKSAILYTVIAGLAILLAMVVAALIVVLQRQ